MNEPTPRAEEILSPRHQEFLKRLRVHDKNVRIGRIDGQLVFRGPVIGDGPMPGEDGDHDAPGAGAKRMADGVASRTRQFRGQDWAVVKQRLSNRYAQLTEADLNYVPGADDALFVRMTARTMESRENIEQFLRDECGCIG